MKSISQSKQDDNLTRGGSLSMERRNYLSVVSGLCSWVVIEACDGFWCLSAVCTAARFEI